VPPGGARRGRRDNGLVAAQYAPVGDVDPRVGEHLLDVLAGDGIAAYLQPAADLNPVTRTTTLPARPTDRLYADREHVDVARGYLARLGPDDAGEPAAGAPSGADRVGAGAPEHAGRTPERGGTPDQAVDLESAWASIVAGLRADTGSDPAAPAWPATENVRDDDGWRAALADGWADTPYRVGDRAPRSDDEPSLLDALDTFGADLGGDDEGYTPPPPPPLPRPSRASVLALVAIVAGLAVFFFPTLLPVDGDFALLLGFSALLAGVVTLIWRLRPGDEEDEGDPDDGAVV
jgi:hypothetical protein